MTGYFDKLSTELGIVLTVITLVIIIFRIKAEVDSKRLSLKVELSLLWLLCYPW